MVKKIKQKKGEKNKDGDIVARSRIFVEIMGIGDNVPRFETDDVIEKKRGTKHCNEKKKNKGAEVDAEMNGKIERKMMGVNGEVDIANAIDNAERKKKKKKKKKKKNRNQDSDTVEFEIGGAANVKVNQGQKMPEEENVLEMRRDKEGKKDKKRWNAMSNHNEVEYERKEEKKKLVEAGTNDPTPNKSNQNLRFSGEAEVFTIPHDSNARKWNDKEENLVRGKRFTREEDEIVKTAVFKYIADHDLGEEGLEMVLNSRKHRELRGCWTEIGSGIPWRPCRSIYDRAQIICRRSEKRKWTQEEYEMVLKYHEVHGFKWKPLADELGRDRMNVRGTWRRIKMQHRSKGRWSQKEYQQLFDLVNTDLQLKVHEEKKSKYGLLRDNICWTAISDKLSTRAQSACCLKWYGHLTSPMVAKGVWADSDDYRMVGVLYRLDANCMEDVDWDNLLDGRSGDLCRKRWDQMVLHIGNHGSKSFSEQVEVLAQRYCPNLLEAREAWDNKPRVP